MHTTLHTPHAKKWPHLSLAISFHSIWGYATLKYKSFDSIPEAVDKIQSSIFLPLDRMLIYPL